MNDTITGTYKGYSAIFKAKVALLALDSDTSISDLSARFNLNEALIRCWKEELLEDLKNEFQEPPKSAPEEVADPKEIYIQDWEVTQNYRRLTMVANENRFLQPSRTKIKIVKADPDLENLAQFPR